MQKSVFALLSLCLLVGGIPNPQLATAPYLDINNPSNSDPTSIPKTISFPTRVAENPYPSGIPSQPDQCDGQNPSDDCFNAMGDSGGYLYFDKDSQCTDDQKSAFETAVWDATTLAQYSNNFPNNGAQNRGQSGAIFYIGPDFASQQTRISGNLKRAGQFKTSSTSDKQYITTSCKDTKGLCGERIEGKAVGGYAWTYNGWFYNYFYITLCPTFFTLDTLATKINDVTQDLAGGSTKMAKDMTWLRSTGQFFLHELMHTGIAVGRVEPHIIDEKVDPEGNVKAYGPRNVHMLARRALGQGGGANRSSTNADSYAILANAAWWWDTTGYFPGLPPRTTQDDLDDADLPLFLHVDLDNSTTPGTADLNTLFTDDLMAFGDAPPEPDDQAASSTTGLGVATTPPSTPPSPSPATDTCNDWYKFFFDHFEIDGKNFDATKFGSDGSGLKLQIKGCGDLTKWNFQTKTNDPNGYQWSAKGNLPIGTKGCVGRAVMSAGGGSPDRCTGAG